MCEEVEPIGLPDRERPQQHRVDEAENGRVRADPEAERNDRYCRERWCPPHEPERIPDVLPQPVEEAQPTRLPAVVTNAIDSAKRHPCLSHRRVWRQAAALQIGGVGVDVELELLRHAVLESAATNEGSDE
jgi:hypothetical protein